MAHEIEYRNGRHSFFEVGAEKTAWHRLGTLLPNAPTLDDAVRLIGADYIVEKKPVTYTNTLPSGVVQSKVSALAFTNVRTDTGAELGAVGPLYQPVQNIDAFRQTIGPLLETLPDDDMTVRDARAQIATEREAWRVWKQIEGQLIQRALLSKRFELRWNGRFICEAHTLDGLRGEP